MYFSLGLSILAPKQEHNKTNKIETKEKNIYLSISSLASASFPQIPAEPSQLDRSRRFRLGLPPEIESDHNNEDN